MTSKSIKKDVTEVAAQIIAGEVIEDGLTPAEGKAVVAALNTEYHALRQRVQEHYQQQFAARHAEAKQAREELEPVLADFSEQIEALGDKHVKEIERLRVKAEKAGVRLVWPSNHRQARLDPAVQAVTEDLYAEERQVIADLHDREHEAVRLVTLLSVPARARNFVSTSVPRVEDVVSKGS
jgi:hypothetical protein